MENSSYYAHRIQHFFDLFYYLNTQKLNIKVIAHVK